MDLTKVYYLQYHRRLEIWNKNETLDQVIKRKKKWFKTTDKNFQIELTRISWPIQEYDSFRFAAQNMANAKQSKHTTKDKTVVSPKTGNFNVFLVQALYLLPIRYEQRKIWIENPITYITQNDRCSCNRLKYKNTIITLI